jgi:hypothetical protein
MPANVFYQRLTIFLDDTHTLDGAVIADSSTITKVQATCSTEPDHARPALLTVLEGVNRAANFVEGSMSVGALTIQVQDNRRVANDQNTGWLTQKLADVGGRDQLVGQRIVLQQYDPWSGLIVVFDGLINDISLNPELTVYTLTTRDMQERGRKLSLFMRAETSVIWPYNNLELNGVWGPGIAGGYGRLNPIDPASPLLVPDAKGVKCVFHRDTNDAAAFNGILEFYDKPWLQTFPQNDWNEIMAQYHVYDFDDTLVGTHATGQGSSLSGRVATGMTVQWRVWGSAGAWTTMRFMPHWDTIDATGAHVWQYNAGSFIVQQSDSKSSAPLFGGQGSYVARVLVQGVAIGSDNAGNLPADGTDCEVRVLSGLPPSDRAPLYLELNAGTFLKNCYDGVYSSVPMDIRYSGIDESGPLLRMIITGIEEDGRSWLEENWYKPLGMFPRINSNGEIVPTKWSLPDDAVALPVLNQDNVQTAGWQHTTSDAISKLSFTYFRDYVDENHQLSTIEVVVDDINAPGTVRLGEKPVEYRPVTIRDVSQDHIPKYGLAPAIGELGYQLFQARKFDTLDRWSLGGQHIAVKAVRSDPVVRALKEGDWVQAEIPWLPDYLTGVRGLNRVAQVATIQDHDPLTRELDLIDGGPFSAPLPAPTITSVVSATGGKVNVTLANVPAGADVKVEYAVAGAAPASGNKAWTFLGRRTGNGVILSSVLPTGNAYFRARSEEVGRRPSAWTANYNFVIPVVYSILRPFIVLNADGTATVRWTPQAGVAGLRVRYEIDNIGTARPANPANSVDVDENLGTWTTPYIGIGKVLFLTVQGFQNFAAGVASGGNSNKQYLPPLPRSAEEAQPNVDIQLTSSTNATVTYTVTATDPLVTELYYAIGNTAFPANPNLASGGAIVVPRATNDAPTRLLRVLAVNVLSGVKRVFPITIDYDHTPEISVDADRVPLFSGTAQIGWRLRGTVDDDCRSLTLTLTSGLTLNSTTPANTLSAGKYWIDTTSTKNWTIDLLQSAGASGSVTLQGREKYNTAAGGLSGPSVAIRLERAALVVHQVANLTATQRRVTLTVNPTTATISYRINGGNWVTPTLVNGATTFDLDVGAAAQIVEYYSTTATGTVSGTVRLVVDQNDQPGILSFVLTEALANKLHLVLGVDDDVIRWSLWARRGNWPTVDTTSGGKLDDQFKRLDTGIHKLTADWTASGVNDATSDWYVIVRAYDDAGVYDQYPTPGNAGEEAIAKIRVTGVSASGSLSNVEAAYDGAAYNVIDWNHDATVEAGGYTVTVTEGVTALVSGRSPKLEPNGSSAIANYGGYRVARQGVAAGTPGAVWRKYTYTVALIRTSDGHTMGTYTAMVTGWYAGGDQSTGVAPTAVPNTLTIDFPNSPSVPVCHWLNPDHISHVQVEVSVSPDGASGWVVDRTITVNPDVVTLTVTHPQDIWVRFRARYTNAYGNGAYSGYSAAVQADPWFY